MDIDSNCPHLLFGETTSYKSEGALFNIIFFNVENSIKSERRERIVFLKKKINTPPPPPRFFFLHQFLFYF